MSGGDATWHHANRLPETVLKAHLIAIGIGILAFGCCNLLINAMLRLWGLHPPAMVALVLNVAALIGGCAAAGWVLQWQTKDKA